jgi:hypothetical protein
MMQKVAWKEKKTSSGIWVPARGAKSTPLRKALPSPPTMLASPSKASEYPTAAQVTAATAIAAMHIMKVLRVFFERTRPA